MYLDDHVTFVLLTSTSTWTMDSQDGRYGKISLLKQGTDVVVTAFGIDVEQLTFGRDPQCSVRLYYPDVSLVHCKIVFEERKVCRHSIS